MTNMAVFEGEKSSNDKKNNYTMSDDEVVASDVPLLLFLCFLFKIFGVRGGSKKI